MKRTKKTPVRPIRPDIESADCCSILLITPLTARGRRWITQRTLPREREYGSDALFCDHRYGMDILHAMLRAGLVLIDAASGQIRSGPARL